MSAWKRKVFHVSTRSTQLTRFWYVSHPSTAPEEMRVCWSWNTTTVTLCWLSWEREKKKHTHTHNAGFCFRKKTKHNLCGRAFFEDVVRNKDTYNTGSHATNAAPPLLCLGGRILLGLVVSAPDMICGFVETIWEREGVPLNHKMLWVVT